MTRKSYRLLAEALGRHYAYNRHLTVTGFWDMVDVICVELKHDNANFDKQKFVYAIEAHSARYETMTHPSGTK